MEADMSARSLPTALAGIGGALGLAEVISSFQIDFPLIALGFAALFALGAWLLRSGRAVIGALLVGVLATFEVVDYPSWAKHGTFDWIFDTTIAVVALAGVCLAVAVLATRRSVGREQVANGRAVRR
jgi:hypothetical protein